MTAAEAFARWAQDFAPQDVPQPVRQILERAVLDTAGLMVAARHQDYVQAVIAACDDDGPCTAIGHAGGRSVADAALIGGTAAHGEDFDDTFEGTPVHVGAVLVPALLAAAQRRELDGAAVLKGLATGAELTCRLALVAPTAMHRQGFHPTAVCGAFGAATRVAVALGLDAPRIASALGIVGSMASGIIEYLAEGTWTKRLHPGWAAQAGWRAARLAEGGFAGPRTVFEGEHGAFKAFAVPGIARDFDHLANGWGETWHVANLAFKPYACGTMAQPFIDCALRLRDEVDEPDDIVRIEAQVGEGTVHRLWEPRSEKAEPSTPYSAKFSVPFCVAIAYLDGRAGLEQFTDARIKDPEARALAAKVGYVIDPDNEYPRNYTGHLTAHLRDGRTVTTEQPYLRGGQHAPLENAELLEKFYANATFGGWVPDRAAALHDFCSGIFDLDGLDGLKRFAG